MTAQSPRFAVQDVFPYEDEHVHGSTLEQLPNGDLLAAWFQGSGERWADDVRLFDQIHDQALHMADALTDGIVKQFPERF